MKLRLLLMIVPITIIVACSSASSEPATIELSGRLVYSQGPEGLWEDDLESGRISQLWKLTEGGFLSGVAVSPDGHEVAMSYAPQSDSPIPRADIYIAYGDGSNAQPLLAHRGIYESFDHPAWSPDGAKVAFAGSGDLSIGATPVRSLRARLFGVRPAYAHGLPWDYYTMLAKGGEITKITSWGTDGAVLARSPDGEYLALMHQGGLFVTKGDEPTMLTETPNHSGVDWAEGTE